MKGPDKKPTVILELEGEDGNSLAITCKVKKALKKAGADKEYTDEFFKKATAGDYDNLLAVCEEYVDVI
jgi:hypothetical protein